jgi:NAD(P)H dehydrogenase (quinone)
MKTLVVYCHPAVDSFASAVLDTTVAALHAARHEVRVTDLYAEDFDPVLSADEHEHHLDDPVTKPGITEHAANLRWCESLVLVYPTWWAGQPAMLKGWIDRVWVNGVAWELPKSSTRLKPLLRNIRRLQVVTTHGSSKWINALEGEGGKRTAMRSLRLLCAPRCRTHWVAMYNIDRSTLEQRNHFLRRVTARLSK